MFIWEQPTWPNFTWSPEALLPGLSSARLRQGRLLGELEATGFELQQEAELATSIVDVVTTSAIEGEMLAPASCTGAPSVLTCSADFTPPLSSSSPSATSTSASMVEAAK